MDTILEAIILPLAIASFAALAVWFITTQSSKRRRVVAAFLILLCVAAMGSTALKLASLQQVRVPNIEQLSTAQAISVMERVGLALDVQLRYSSEAEYRIIPRSQNPPPDIAVAKGSTVTVQVSCGPIPDVSGIRIGDAIAALRQAGLRPRVKYVENGANESEDIVLDQRLYPADPKSPGARITITTKERLPPPSYFEIVFPTSSGLRVPEKYVIEGTLPPEIAAQLTTNSTLRIVVIIHPCESPDEFWVQDAQVTIEDHLWAAYPVYFGTYANGHGKRFEVYAITVRAPVNQCLLNLREFEELIKEADVKAPSIEVERSY